MVDGLSNTHGEMDYGLLSADPWRNTSISCLSYLYPDQSCPISIDWYVATVLLSL